MLNRKKDPGTAKLDQPNLLIVGFAKCGTTSLAKYLSDHPDVCAPVVKETYFLVDEGSPFSEMSSFLDDTRVYDRSKQSLFAEFRKFIESYESQRYLFDATPFHYCQAGALDYAASRSDVKVMFLVRSPEERLRSSYLFFTNVQQEYPNVSFEGFVDALLSDAVSRDRIHDSIVRPFFRAVFESDLSTGHYADHIDPWAERLGRERIYVGKMEDMRDDPRRFMTEVCNFLNIDPSPYDDYQFKVYQKTFNVRFPLMQRMLRKIVKSDPMRIDLIAEHHNGLHLIKNPLIRGVVDRAYRYLQAADRSYATDSHDLKRLRRYYEPYNLRLEKDYNTFFRH